MNPSPSDTTSIVSLGAGALTLAAVQAGVPLAVGFGIVGVLGAAVGHARTVSELERKGAAALTSRQHVCMIGRGVLMAEFVCMIILLAWVEYGWPWTWGLIFGAIASVFASEAIELMWVGVQTRFRRAIGIGER